MRKNTAKQRMLEGKPAIGAEVGLGSPLAAELLSQLGFDWITVDNQHGAWQEESTIQAFRGISFGSAIPMARVQQNSFGAIGRLLDIGAMGIIVPMVNSVEEAQAAARAVRYPPRGGRSGGPFGTSFLGLDYMSWIDDELFLAVQIESAQAVEHADEIMAVDGIDGCWVGPGDLGMSMGVDRSTPEGREAHTAAIDRVIAACRKTGKIPGIALGTVQEAQYWIERGCLFVTTGTDRNFMLDSAQETLRQHGRSP